MGRQAFRSMRPERRYSGVIADSQLVQELRLIRKSLVPVENIKSLGNTDTNGASKNVSDLVVWGEGDMWKLLSKASSKKEGWMKSTKALEIPGVGCFVQVSTQQGNNVAESITFAEGVKIIVTGETDVENSDAKIVTSRRLVAIDYVDPSKALEYKEEVKDKEPEKEVEKFEFELTTDNPYEVTRKFYNLLRNSKTCKVKINGQVYDVIRIGTSALISTDDCGTIYTHKNWTREGFHTTFDNFLNSFAGDAINMTVGDEINEGLFDVAELLSSESGMSLSKLNPKTQSFTRFLVFNMAVAGRNIKFYRHSDSSSSVGRNYVELVDGNDVVYRSQTIYGIDNTSRVKPSDTLQCIQSGFVMVYRNK